MPLPDIRVEATSQILIDHDNDWYELNIEADIVRGLPHGKLTEILAVSDGGWVEVASRESVNKPELEITYEYVSVGSSVSPSYLIEGQSVAVNVNTDPPQIWFSGNIKIQYSTDQINWIDIGPFSGGSTHYAWTPPITGQIYVRALWEISWTGGSYYTISSVNAVWVIPIYIPILIPAIIVGIIIGTYYWRKRKK